MKNFQKAIAIIALSGLCFAAPAPAPSDGDPGVKKSKHVAKKDQSAEQLKDLKALIEQQQAALQQVQQELKQTQQQLQQTQQQLGITTQTAKQAEAKADTVDTTNLNVQKVQSDLSDVKAAVNTSTEVAKKAEKKVDALEHPASIAYKGVRLTPGGFFDLTGVYRTHAMNSGPASQFNATPLENALTSSTSSTAVGGLSEFELSGRGTRLSLRADADAGSTMLRGYVEGDFYGTPLANPNQTTSYAFRIRQGWGRASWANGWKITGGQMWNLVTMNRKAADADAAWAPNTIDTNYVVGFDFGRQAELRIAKTFDKKYTFALGLVDPSTLSNLNSVTTMGQVAGLATAGSGNLGSSPLASCLASASLCPVADPYSTNMAPDLVLKLAYDNPKLGHYEIKGVGRFFRERVLAQAAVPVSVVTGVTTAFPAVVAHNAYADGAGIGGGAIIPVLPKKVDFLFQGLYGKGISRYEDGGQYDVWVRTNTVDSKLGTLTSAGADNGLQLVKSFSVVAGFETHPTPKLEADLYFGDEYYYRDLYSVYSITGASTINQYVLTGYGSPTAAAGGNNKNVAIGTATVWYDLYKGSYGTLRYGAQYEYTQRGTWSGNGKSLLIDSSLAGTTLKGIDNIGEFSIRYILP